MSYIVLENANRLTTLNTQKLIKVLEKVIKQNEMKEVRKLFSRLMRDIALDVNLLWSVYNNINTQFKLLKKELIDLGFASATSINDGDDEMKLVN